MTNPTVQLALKSLANLLHLRGEGLNEILASFGAESLEIFQYQSLGEGQFVAKLGTDELYLSVEPSVELAEEKNQYAFPRGDAAFELSGNWKALLSEVCIYDFRQCRPGDFLMVSIAGISAWLLIPESDKPLILGCDPTYGHYFQETLIKQIEKSPFLKTELENDD
ncbi:hypothetical protein [Thiomicrorhabdus sp. 6S3-12]|uniref:hypothetical protein n=1 Tax=Thiomicrorhabdus sp. 6S3-12 TaxID=2819681 RepID=UPI001AAD3068|nr:hypothetical protein [Thiomicrorhabdus sp. 6S3-12]MBO1923392.1 hypothetical protein [Thiomicrorhabdus sp. 6S3-12]